MSKLTLTEQGVDVDTPSAGQVTLYAKDGKWYSRNGDTGTITELGAQFVYEEDAENTTYVGTTSDSWSEHLKLTTSSTDAGRYRIDWFAVYSNNVATADIYMRVQVNDTVDLINPDATDGNEKMIRLEVTDVAGIGNGNTNQRLPLCGFAYATLSAGVHTIDFDFRPEFSGNLVAIHHSRLSIRRIS